MVLIICVGSIHHLNLLHSGYYIKNVGMYSVFKNFCREKLQVLLSHSHIKIED